MAKIVQVGNRWRVQLADDTFLLSNKTGHIRYFNSQDMAQLYADNMTARENNDHPSPPSWRQVVQEAREKVYTEMQKDRYYVQPLGREYLVRERGVEDEADVTIRRFTNPGSAAHYAGVMNDQQRHLDVIHGRWKAHAMTPEITGEKE